MFVRGIPDQLWPVHPRPIEGELLTSWLVRCAHANRLRAESFCSALFGSRSAVWNRDFDRCVSLPQIERIAHCSGMDVAVVQGCTLRALEGTLTGRVNQHGNSPGLIPLRIYHRIRKRAGLMFCPECLRSDPQIYWRRLWRISYVTACPQHGCELLDTCPFCGSEVAPHRTDVHWDVYPGGLGSLLARCHNCYHDLRTCTPSDASTGELKVARYVADALRDRWVQIDGSSDVSDLYALSFFGGLRCLLAGVRGRERRLTKVGEVRDCSGIARHAAGFDHDQISDRRKQIERVGAFLEDWPRSFLKEARALGIKYTSLMSDRAQMPYWVDAVARQELYRSYAAITHEQVESIARATDVRQARFSAHAARLLSGHSLELRMFANVWVGGVDRDTCELFLAEIDHLAAQIWDRKRRIAVVGDKVMFAFAWRFGLTQVQLSQIVIRDLDQGDFVVPGAHSLPSFWSFPDSKGQVLAWVHWYVNHIRPLLEPREQEERVFVSHTTRSALSASAIGERFRQYRHLTGMHRAIADYPRFVRSGQMSFDSSRRTKS